MPKIKKRKSDSTPKFVGTCNNYTEEHVRLVMSVPVQRCIVSKEVGDSGTPHLQAAFVFARSMRYTGVNKLLGGGWSIFEMEGTWADQIYCAKEGSEVIRMEDNTRQGRRTDIIGFRDAIRERKTDLELLEHFPNEVCKYPRFLPFVRKVLSRQAAYAGFSKLSVKIYWGAAGAGKSKFAKIWDFSKQYELGLTQPKQWFGDYQSQPSILMNEFAGQWPLSNFLKRTDGNTSRYEEVKGDGIYLTNKEWIFTSNIDPKDWYKSTFDKSPNTDLEEAFNRRITEIVYFEKDKAPVWQKGSAFCT
jgi:hypothetical protein